MEEEIEIWKDVAGYNGFYQISSFGRLRRPYIKVFGSKNGTTYQKIFKEKIRKPHLNKDGYLYVGLSKGMNSKTLKIHRLVAEAFVPNPENKAHIDHIDGNKQNNHCTNIRWCTHAENIAFAWALGLYNNIGSNHGMSKLNETMVLDIKKEISEGKKSIDIARKHNISQSSICDIKKGRLWNHV